MLTGLISVLVFSHNIWHQFPRIDIDFYVTVCRQQYMKGLEKNFKGKEIIDRCSAVTVRWN